MNKHYALLLAVALTMTTVPPASAATAVSDLYGRWILNDEATREVQPRQREKSGLFSNLPRASVSVGGIPLPGSGSGAPPSTGGAPDPKVLRTAELTIEPQGDNLHLSFGVAGSETLKPGNDQGLVSRWNKSRLTSRYKTTSRSVNQVYEVQKDGRLLVTVKLNPSSGPTLVHKRMFDRAAAPDQ